MAKVRSRGNRGRYEPPTKAELEITQLFAGLARAKAARTPQAARRAIEKSLLRAKQLLGEMRTPLPVMLWNSATKRFEVQAPKRSGKR